ncbi:MAG: ATP-binding protein [Planctomycetes bacterium]|nr:ATP-binding protein [Planctomycetota bacterium]
MSERIETVAEVVKRVLHLAAQREVAARALPHAARGPHVMIIGHALDLLTVSASVASALGRPMIRVDLGAVASKYIGETEKNLSRLLMLAEAAGAVLLFDEADALFGRRGDVKDAHDRYANIEVSYLLQRLETFGPLVILGAARCGNLDEAFVRRLDWVVEVGRARG